MRALFIAMILGAAALIAGAACAQKTESTVVTIPTATPVDTPTASPTPTTSSGPIATPKSPTPMSSGPQHTATPLPTATPTQTPTPTATPTPEPSLATGKAAALLVGSLGVPAPEVSFDSVKPMQWSNAALGCPEPGRAYAEVIVPGWLIILRHDTKLYEYHADREGDRVITCDPKLVRTYGMVNVAAALRLTNASRVEILAIDPANGTPVSALTIANAVEVSNIVASLDVDLPLYEPKPCSPLLEVRLTTGDRVESVLYACAGDGTVLRGSDEAFQGKEARAPEAFQKLINNALANRPFPTPPACRATPSRGRGT